MNQFWVYILKCNDGSYYTGHTDDIDARLSQHKQGLISGCYTINKRPLELVYCKVFELRDDAFKTERQIKGWSRKKKEAFIKGDWNEIKRLNKEQKMGVRPSTGSG
ncbi:hypothetical protein LCGC14_2202650 [marine sediment metagenome]|uniref:GIY-YIG domain-containing protein n=1 Tax=marine sediment metagenome TaxID=412755 RepID=A0A0F9DGC2_9ZZZZ